MFDIETIVNLLIDNAKKLFFPEEWVSLDLKFSKSEIFTLIYISKKNEVTMTELVEYINSPMSTATGIVDRLVKNGYISRERSDTDRRIVVLKLTGEGTRLVNSIKEIISKYLSMIVDDLTEEEKRFIMEIVIKIMHNIQTKLDAGKADFEDKKDTTIKEIPID
ncbi:MAG TPA: MarR family transcriptional regulator [Mobilitalea sp.]|nr:MarR family transcriptional regulator [Mobilitalea sp.]